MYVTILQFMEFCHKTAYLFVQFIVSNLVLLWLCVIFDFDMLKFCFKLNLYGQLPCHLSVILNFQIKFLFFTMFHPNEFPRLLLIVWFWFFYPYASATAVYIPFSIIFYLYCSICSIPSGAKINIDPPLSFRSLPISL